jgi:hypothetical protein
MSLRERILIVLLGMLCCYAGLEFFVLKKVVAPELSRQEQQQAIENVYRCKKVVREANTPLARPERCVRIQSQYGFSGCLQQYLEASR